MSNTSMTSGESVKLQQHARWLGARARLGVDQASPSRISRDMLAGLPVKRGRGRPPKPPEELEDAPPPVKVYIPSWGAPVNLLGLPTPRIIIQLVALRARWQALLWRRFQLVRLADGIAALDGVVEGLAPSGGLLLRDSGGVLREITTGELTLG